MFFSRTVREKEMDRTANSYMRKMTGNVACVSTVDKEIRFRATSGGLGSCLVRFLFEQGLIGSALSFSFDSSTLCYVPRIIYDIRDYEQVGSIYQDVNLIAFVRNNVKYIRGPFFCFALGCQVQAVKSLLSKAGVEHYVVELVCSSQQSLDATKYLLHRLHIPSQSVRKIQYRGNGWPGGVQIEQKNGDKSFVSNTGSVWMEIFHSKLFVMPRCFMCNPKRESGADLIIGDPWRIDSPETENVGRSLCYVKSERMRDILCAMRSAGLIAWEEVEEKLFSYSMQGPLRRKSAALRHQNLVRRYRRFIQSDSYKQRVCGHSWLFKFHCLVNNVFERILNRL